MKNKTVVPRVTICCDFRFLPTRTGNESFRILPVAIVDGTVTNRKDPVLYAKEKCRLEDKDAERN
jgi:hypothetical protein